MTTEIDDEIEVTPEDEPSTVVQPVTRKAALKPASGQILPMPPEPGVTTAVLADLARETPASEIKQRPALRKGGGQAYKPDSTPLFLSYVDARYVYDTLDEIVGPANWQSAFQETVLEGVRAGIGINVRGVGWVWKWDAGVPSNIEPVKGAHSDALKRAAVQWGIGRDLYDRPDDDVDQANALPTVQQAAQPQGTARDQRYAGSAPQAAAPVVQTDNRTADEVEQDAMAQGLMWACPDHPSAPLRYTPAGITKSEPHRPYAARIRCSTQYCKQNGPFIPVL